MERDVYCTGGHGRYSTSITIPQQRVENIAIRMEHNKYTMKKMHEIPVCIYIGSDSGEIVKSAIQDDYFRSSVDVVVPYVVP